MAGAAYSQRRSIIEVPNLVLGGLVVGLGLAAVVTPPRSRSAAAAATAVALAGPSVLGTFILCWSAVGDRFAC